MKKVTKRAIALVLTLILMMSAVSISAFAASETTVKQYKTYVSLGDSIAGGFSMPHYLTYKKLIVSKKSICGSYPDLVAEQVNAEKFYPLAQPGFRTNEIRLMLDPTYNGDEISEKYLGRLSGAKYTLENLTVQRPEYIKKVKEADLITLDIGFNDTWIPIAALSLKMQDNLNAARSDESIVADYIEQLGGMGAFLEYTYNAIYNILSVPEYAIKFQQALYKIFIEVNTNYTAIVNKIYELNPDVTVVSLDCYNPFRDWDVPKGSGVKTLAMLTQPLYNTINANKRTAGAVHGDKYICVNNDNVELITKEMPPLDQFGDLLGGGFNPHPTVAGHKDIADHIIAALPEGKRSSSATIKHMYKINGSWGVYDGNLNRITTYTGIASTAASKWYVSKGRFVSSKNGKVNYGGHTYTIKNGKVTAVK